MSISSRTNRKVLINPHTSSENTKPIGILNLGEIGVEHSGVDSAKLYVETNPTSNSANTIATFITENETKGYINGRISGITEIISDLISIVLTAGTGDDIIQVTIPSASANTFVISHKSGSEQSGFKKLETDSYGHVTAATDVTTDDIVNLSGFSEIIQEIVVSGITEETERAMSAETMLKYNIDALAGATKTEFERVDKNSLSAITINNKDKKVVNNKVNLGDYLSASTTYIKSVTTTTEEGTGNKVLSITDSQNNTTEIVETIIIDCGEY